MGEQERDRAGCDEGANGWVAGTYHGQPVFDPRRRHPVDALADYARGGGLEPDPLRLAAGVALCDEQVTLDGTATGMWDYPQAVPAPLMYLLAGFCVGVTESRPPNQCIGRSNNPYIDRWFLGRKISVPEFSGPPEYADVAPFMASEIENIYLHGYHRGDADEPHDHPWPNASLVVRGWYRENIHTLDGKLLGAVVRRPGDIVLRRASSVHAILETSPDCLSLFATLRKERDWGFHTADGFVPWREFDSSPTGS